MTNTTISPYMNLPVPVPGQDPGPDWANNIVADMYGIDSHDHSFGQGVAITPGGLNINADLPMADNNLTTAKSIRFQSQTSPLALPADIGCIYESGVDLYFNDGAGNQVRITQGGSVTGSTGTITGLPSGTASASFAGGTFTFQSATSTPATMALGPLVLGASVASPKTVTLAASAVQPANYNLTFPLAAPAANQVPISDGSGNLSWTLGILPLGSVLATFPNLTGAYSTVATTVADARGFVKCNGQTIVDATSPMNGAVIPNINNMVFLAGNTTSGTSGGSATATLSAANLGAHTHGPGSYITSVGVTGGTSTLGGTTNFASTTHTHNFSHVHEWAFGGAGTGLNYALTAINDAKTSITSSDVFFVSTNNVGQAGGSYTAVAGWNSSNTHYYTTGVLSAPSGSGSSASTGTPSASGGNVTISSTPASITGSNSVTGTSSSTGSATAFSILPTYITAVYLMRIR